MKIEANTPQEYLDKLPPDRKEALEKLRLVKSLFLWTSLDLDLR